MLFPVYVVSCALIWGMRWAILRLAVGFVYHFCWPQLTRPFVFLVYTILLGWTCFKQNVSVPKEVGTPRGNSFSILHFAKHPPIEEDHQTWEAYPACIISSWTSNLTSSYHPHSAQATFPPSRRHRHYLGRPHTPPSYSALFWVLARDHVCYTPDLRFRSSSLGSFVQHALSIFA